MRSRGRLAFRPRLANAVGVDWLECRQLLSGVGQSLDVADVAPTRAVASPALASRVPAPPTNLPDVPSAPTADTAKAAGNSGESASTLAQPTTAAASPAFSGGETSRSDSGEAVTHAVGVSSQPTGSNSANAVAGAGVVSPTEQTPGDEGPTAPTSEPAVAEQPGDVGWAIGAGLSPNGRLDGATAMAPAEPALALAPAVTVASGTATAPLANVGLSAVAAATDGALLTSDGAVRDTVTAASSPTRVCTGPDTPTNGVRSDGDGTAIETRSIDEPAPSPRCADLLTEFLPFDRASLEDAIDRFLAPFEELGAGLASWQSPTNLLPAATIVVTVALTSEVARRRANRGETTREVGEEAFAQIPGYPSSWSLGES